MYVGFDGEHVAIPARATAAANVNRPRFAPNIPHHIAPTDQLVREPQQGGVNSFHAGAQVAEATLAGRVYARGVERLRQASAKRTGGSHAPALSAASRATSRLAGPDGDLSGIFELLIVTIMPKVAGLPVGRMTATAKTSSNNQ